MPIDRGSGGCPGLAPTALDVGPTEHFAAIVGHLAQLDHHQGPAAVIAPAAAVYNGVVLTAKRFQGRRRDHCLRLAAQCAELIGWLHQDSRQHGLAQEWTVQALDLAEAVQARELIAYILMRRSAIAIDMRQADKALLLAERALRYGRNGAERALALRAVAAAHALEKAEVEFREALERALDHASDDSPRSPLTVYCGIPYACSEAGASALLLGDLSMAVDYLERAARGWGAGQRRDRALCWPAWRSPTPRIGRWSEPARWRSKPRRRSLRRPRRVPQRSSKPHWQAWTVGRTASTWTGSATSSPGYAEAMFPTSTSAETAHREVAVLPVGSFEQHGAQLPLATDTVIASEIARRVAEAYGLFVLPPVCFSCSQEHAAFPGTVSIRASTLGNLIEDISADLGRAGTERLIIVNGHGGNNVLTNVVQQANVGRRTMLLYPTSYHWSAAREAAGCSATTHQDMHAGEAETSILLSIAPELVREGWQDADCEADDRSLLTLLGMDGYTASGVIGRPSLSTAEKGHALLDALVAQLGEALKLLAD